MIDRSLDNVSFFDDDGGGCDGVAPDDDDDDDDDVDDDLDLLDDAGEQANDGEVFPRYSWTACSSHNAT